MPACKQPFAAFFLLTLQSYNEQVFVSCKFLLLQVVNIWSCSFKIDQCWIRLLWCQGTYQCWIGVHPWIQRGL